MPSNNDDLIINPTPRCACMLLLDSSYSMHGKPIEELNQGVNQFIEEVCQDKFASFAVELGVLTFDTTVTEVVPIQSISQVNTPVFTAQGATSMGSAILRAIKLLDARKEEYKKKGVAYYQPWIVIMTDGEPTDEDVYPQAAAQLRRSGENNKYLVFGIGIGDYCNLNKLALACPANRPPKKLSGYRFRDFFKWLSASMAQVSVSTPGTSIDIPSTKGWEDIRI
ncbi:VWA domain-containing protein [Leptolyngbyaceae cyanobacterium CCMR0082]|uniref:VWA domain-containing protein n=1 Tax=Adonisia turfae CCMR0082 TaxID=2304604 RepID=A0A6M0SMD2_9CYAN|nr:VWA domain-containing protein [Adonisia turfae]NEZ68362.1 VWA domain-containing protein [Adonisia turfae CCMR0082]